MGEPIATQALRHAAIGLVIAWASTGRTPARAYQYYRRLRRRTTSLGQIVNATHLGEVLREILAVASGDLPCSSAFRVRLEL